jgi:glycosyltransferase involved in cell wall biosynthesis
MVRRYAASSADVAVRFIDISPRWRAAHDLRLWLRAAGGSLQFARDLSQFVALLLRWRPEVVHLTTHGQLAVLRDLLLIKIAGLFGLRVLYHIRFGRVPELVTGRSLEWRAMKRALLNAYVVVAIDAATERALEESLPGIRVVRIPNCVDLASLPNPATRRTKARTVVYLGRVVPRKGIGELVEAWASLGSGQWRLRIVGPVAQEYRRELSVRCGTESVEFAGELSHVDAMRALAAAELIVLPSHTEGFPNVVLEAMGLGRAIVATSVGALPELLDGGCGILIPPRDPLALRAVLGSLTKDAHLRSTLGANARRKARDCYSLERVFAQYVSLWRAAARASPEMTGGQLGSALSREERPADPGESAESSRARDR